MAEAEAALALAEKEQQDLRNAEDAHTVALEKLEEAKRSKKDAGYAARVQVRSRTLTVDRSHSSVDTNDLPCCCSSWRSSP